MGFSNYYSLVLQAIRKEPLTVYGDGKQTRSFQYVTDLVWQLCKSMYMSLEISLFSGGLYWCTKIYFMFSIFSSELQTVVLGSWMQLIFYAGTKFLLIMSLFQK
jgi:hypothetical protein